MVALIDILDIRFMAISMERLRYETFVSAQGTSVWRTVPHPWHSNLGIPAWM